MVLAFVVEVVQKVGGDDGLALELFGLRALFLYLARID
jgi:hypothetical protein